MAIIDIWSIINPIKNDLQQKAWQIVNDVTFRVSNIVSGLIDGAKTYISSVIFNVGNMINGALSNIRSTIESVRIGIENKINGIIATVSSAVNGIVNTIRDIKDTFFSSINSFRVGLESKLSDVRYQIQSKVEELINRGTSLISSYIHKIEEKVGVLLNKVIDIGENIISKITSTVSNLAGDIANRLKTTYDNVTNKVGDYIRQARDIINEKIDYVKNNLSLVKDRIENKISETKDYLQRNIDEIRDRITNKVNQVKDDITKGIEIAIEKIKAKFEVVKEDIRDFIDRQIKAVKDRIDSIMEQVKDSILEFTKWAENYLDGIKDIVHDELDARFKDFSGVFYKLSKGQYQTYDDFIKDFNEIGGSGGIISVLSGLIIVGSTYLNSVNAIGIPFTQNISSLAMSEALPTRLSPPQIARAYMRGMIDPPFATDEMRANGVNAVRQDLLYDLEREITSPGEAQIAFLRGMITESKHDDILKKWGFTDEKIELIKELYFILPPISDLITMSVREVFSPATTERFGQFEDYPPLFGDFAKQQGLSEDWAKRYWAAHWSLPSPTQGFEMLHRRIIERDDLVLLLKALDIMPFWREKLIQLSYNPLTRVDVRRMHAVGVINEQQVYESYLDIGYNETNARRLTEFTVKLNSPKPDNVGIEIRTLTRSIIEQAYRQGIIDRDNALSRLMKIGYDGSDASFLLEIQDSLRQIESSPEVRNRIIERTIKMVLSAYATRTFGRNEAQDQLIQLGLTQLESSTELDLVDYEINTKLKQRYVGSIQDLYTNWVIDESDLFIFLNDLGFSQGEIGLLVEELSIVRNTRTKLPTMTDLKRWVNGGIITLEQYINDLKGQGFPDIYIDRYVAELGVAE